MTKFPPWWFPNRLPLPQPVLEASVGLLSVAFLFSVVCRSEEANFPSTTSTLPVTVGLILFWFDKNLFLSLLQFVVVTSICTEFSLESLPEQGMRVSLEVCLIP